MNGPAFDGMAVSIGRRVLAAAVGALLLASVAAAQPTGRPSPEVAAAAPADGGAVLTVPAMTACIDALRRMGARTVVEAGVSCTVGTTTHQERVGYCLFRPAGGGGLPMLELFREPATHPGRGTAVSFVYDAGVVVAPPDLPGVRVFHFFADARPVAIVRLSLAPLSSLFEPPPREAPAPVTALLRDGDAVREACFGLDLAS